MPLHRQHRVRGAALALFLVATGLPSLASAARGGDQGTGYEWVDTADGATEGPSLFDGPITTINPPNNSASVMITLPWMFPYCGGSSNTIYVSDNGYLTITDQGGPFATPAAIFNAAPPNGIIAPFWTDLDVTAAGRNIRHGTCNVISAYRISWNATIVATATQVVFDAYLYQDGRIKFHYLTGANAAAATVGMECLAGTDGFGVVNVGVPAPGVSNFFNGTYAIDIYPPPALIAECGLIPTVGCGTTINESLPGTLPMNILTYGCNMTSYAANERIYKVTLTEPSRLQANLTPGTATSLQMFLLDGCSERNCVRQGTRISALLAAGDYYLVVEAPAVANQGTFTLAVNCSPLGEVINCGDTRSGDTTTGASEINTYPCFPSTFMGGREAWYFVTLPTGGNLRATLLNTSPNLNVLILDISSGGEITNADCVLHAITSAVYWSAPPGDYAIVVDGQASVSGPYTLETDCATSLDCSSLAGIIDFNTGDVQDIVGDTTGGTDLSVAYRCGEGVFHGSEVIYELIVPRDGQIGLFEPLGAAGFGYFVLSSCDPADCVASSEGGCDPMLPAGTYYLVVDGPEGGDGPFRAQAILTDIQGHWTSCELPDGATRATDTVSTIWEFTDGAYCYSDPASINFPDGCSFAMYVAPQCGTEFHIPLFDVESGHVRVFDILRNQYVTLTARSAGFLQTGTDISWQDCAGTDPAFNDTIVDIYFERPEGLCGIYRIEFPLHSGFVWDLYANCTGTAQAGFPIYDSLCGAAAAFDPLPNVNLLSATGVTNCPCMDVTYTLINNGCAAATNVEVSLIDDGVGVHVDVVPVLAANTTITRTFTACFPAGFSSDNVWLYVDDLNNITECEEFPGAGCNVVIGVDALQTVDCGQACEIRPQGVADPPVRCGAGTVNVDASATIQQACPGGIVEYQLTGDFGVLPWQPSPLFNNVMITDTTDLLLEGRCADPAMQATCFGSTTIRVPVDWAPTFDPASIATVVDCDPGIALSWSAATFNGPTGTGGYNIYRSETSCADAVTRPPIRSTQNTSIIDATVLVDIGYFYVVEAEDETAVPGGCQPPGPVFGGATTRGDALGGNCVALFDRRGTPADQLPLVGPSLRLGSPAPYSENEVTLRWSTSFPLDEPEGEHFHVLRSDRPDTGFTRLDLPDPPWLQIPQFTDNPAAPGTPLLCYLVFVADICHDDNSALDR